MRQRRPRVLLVGDIGGASTLHVGDEAMFEADLELVRRLVPSAACTAVSADPEYTASLYGIDAVPRPLSGFPDALERLDADSEAAITSAAEADLLVVTGGGNLNSSFPTMIAERLVLARATARAGGDIVILGQSLGPALTPADAERLGELLDLATFVGVRDPSSVSVARSLGVESPKIVEQLDDAWAMEGTIPEAIGIDLDRLFIAVTFHPDASIVAPVTIRALAEQLALIGSHSGAPIVFVPHCRMAEGPRATTDEDVGAALAEQLASLGAPVHSLPVLAPRDVIAVTQAAGLVLSSRYHPLVFATGAAVPALAIWTNDYVRAKQLGALGHVGLEDWTLGLEAAIGGGLALGAIELWDRREELVTWLTAAQPSLRAQASGRDAVVAERLRTMQIKGQIPNVPVPPPVALGDAPAPTGRWHAFGGAAPAARPVPDSALAELLELKQYARALEIDRDALRSRVAHGSGDPPAPAPAARTITVLDRMRLEVDGDRIALVGRVSAPHLDETDVRFRVYDAGLAARVDASATPFLPPLTLLAARLGTDLVIDAPVDGLALENADRVAATLCDWWGWRPPRITAAATMPATPRATGTGLWFSRGVDSTDTLMRALAGELLEDGQPVQVTHLLGLDWIDPPFAVSSTPEAWSDTTEAAASLGLPLLRFSTDVRRLVDPALDWTLSHGAVFAGLGLFLGPMLGAVLLSATSVGDASPPYGSHPALDPLWSTTGTRIVHVGAERTRSEKVTLIAEHEWALSRLKVCWEADTPRNCGRCCKCLVTMTLLDTAGALDRCDRFDGVMSVDAVRRIAQGPRPIATVPSSVADILRVLPPEASELRAAWTAVQDRLQADAER